MDDRIATASRPGTQRADMEYIVNSCMLSNALQQRIQTLEEHHMKLMNHLKSASFTFKVLNQVDIAVKEGRIASIDDTDDANSIVDTVISHKKLHHKFIPRLRMAETEIKDLHEDIELLTTKIQAVIQRQNQAEDYQGTQYDAFADLRYKAWEVQHAVQKVNAQAAQMTQMRNSMQHLHASWHQQSTRLAQRLSTIEQLIMDKNRENCVQFDTSVKILDALKKVPSVSEKMDMMSNETFVDHYGLQGPFTPDEN